MALPVPSASVKRSLMRRPSAIGGWPSWEPRVAITIGMTARDTPAFSSKFSRDSPRCMVTSFSSSWLAPATLGARGTTVTFSGTILTSMEEKGEPVMVSLA